MAVHMLHGTQFNIAFILIATLIVAVLLAFGQVWPVVFIVAQFLFVYLGSEYLCRNLPNSVRKLQFANCSRADGSQSQHRASVERKEHRGLRSNLRLLLFIAVAPSFLLLWYDSFELNNLMLVSSIWLIVAFFVVRSGLPLFLESFCVSSKATITTIQTSRPGYVYTRGRNGRRSQSRKASIDRRQNENFGQQLDHSFARP